ncbi:UvrD-helicase domain-containing protein [Nitrosomonas halophila]|uniref:DNA 3'-5' helicase n=1 Tax=Nitrosomonas halophila TaxID=44576 RepID=A0A1H3ETU8_9PROT|nr:UvrD-helicase domain-containing protein [Nitrosomonas halophila]SDX81359.1 ATP-dependent exoDNAse (exonuclease V) beta subunit (contains helicase and exonuclease domains) [Nitrosomonas halophila]
MVADQAARLQALDPSCSFIVQAPAGSGKTGLLTQRFLVLLATVDEPEEIIAITFTRKAASEMRQRITQALRDASCLPAPEDAYAQQTWQLARSVLMRDQALDWQLLRNPSRLRIQTIDALCAQLVNQMPVHSKQGGVPAVAEDADGLYLEAARLTVLALEGEGEWSAAVAHLIQYLDNRLDKLQRLIADMLARRDQWLHHLAGITNADAIRKRLESALTDQITAAMRTLAENAPVEYRMELVDLARFAASQLAADASQNKIVHCECLQEWPGWRIKDRLYWEGLAALLLTQAGAWRKQVTKNEGFPAATSVRAIEVKKQLEEMKRRMRAVLAGLQGQESFRQQLLSLRRLPPEGYTDNEWETLQALFRLLKVAAGYLTLVFQERGQVDFAEITMAAIHALGEPDAPTDLALALDYRMRHVLVDEFQDTSFNQSELLARLTAGWQSGDGRTLFLVGDPMQSIYRFRQAEVGLFLDIRDRGFFGQIPVKFLRLSVNFRSQRGIVDWVNQYFPRILPYLDDVSTGAVSYASAEASHPLSHDKAVTVYPCLQRDDVAEAEQVVTIVQQAKKMQPDGKIAILVRTRSHLASIVPRLRQAGLRFQAVEIEHLAERPVIQDLTALTRALLHPGDRIAWLAVLRAPYCGLSLQDMYFIAGKDAGHIVVDSLHEPQRLAALSAEGCQRLQRVLPVLDCALATRDQISLRRSVEGAWIQLGGPACVPDETDLADAEVYFQLLEKLDETGHRPDVQELDERLAQLYALPDVAADDGLQIMTLHKAKGLEFDTVVLPGLGRQPRRDQEKLLNWLERRARSGALDLLCAPISAPGGDKNPISAYLLSIEKHKAALEDARLLYVAVTRAKHHLHLLGHISAKTDSQDEAMPVPAADTLLAKLWPAVVTDFQARLNAETAAQATEQSCTETQPGFNGRVCLAADWHPPGTPPAIQLPVVRQPTNLAVESVDFNWAGEPARLVGLVVHRLLQRIGMTGIEALEQHDLSRLEYAGRSLLRQLAIEPQYLDAAAQQVAVALKAICVDDPVGRWILSGRHVDMHCEWALSVSGNGAEASLNTIDRSFVDAAGTRWIIDYKTGTHTGSGIEEFIDREQLRYRSQLERYAEILSQMENRPIRLGIYFPLLSKWREWAYPPHST